jgi:hypothetical protein
MDDIAAPPANLPSEVCPNCGEFATLNEVTGWCEKCSPTDKAYSKLESYLAKNADEIEHYMTQGMSVGAAIDMLHSPKVRPTCIVCGGVIVRAQRSAIFCRRTYNCRRYARRYVYLYQTKGLSKSEALSRIFEQLAS